MENDRKVYENMVIIMIMMIFIHEEMICVS